MEAPPRKRGRPPKHPKVAPTDSPPALLPHSHTHHAILNSPPSPADVEMVDRVVPPVVDSRSGPRGRKKSSVADKVVDASASAKPDAGAGGSPSTRELSKSEADDADSPVERLSSRRTKKPSLVPHNASSPLRQFLSIGSPLVPVR